MFFLLFKSYTNGKKSSILAQLPMCQFKVNVTIEGQLSIIIQSSIRHYVLSAITPPLMEIFSYS